LGLRISPFGRIYFPPIISGYVGADITSGILASELHRQDKTILFVDIGTNGEIVLAHNETLTATSTAAGPAFEGMNISCGMRAAPGAIEKCRIEYNGKVHIKTIGDIAPVGICGSGLIDIVGELLLYGIIQNSGRFISSVSNISERLGQREGSMAFQIADDVYLSQKDIRQVQLAKGAIRAGIEALLRHKGLTPEKVDVVYIAGSFGYHLNPRSLVRIGLLPQTFFSKIEFLGNTSKTGGHAMLVNKEIRVVMQTVVRQVEVLELSLAEGFDTLFVECLNF
jgi:uncharacterized 2Fe-2S/4Fe-4S cluster protein (DUF4445 family)